MARRGSGSSSDNSPKTPITKESFQKGRRIFSYIRPYKYKFIIGMFFLVVSSSISMAFPALAGKLVDSATGKAGSFFLKDVNAIAIGLFSIILLQSFFSFFRIYFFSQVSENAVADIRRDLYAKFVVLPIPFFEQRRVGEITSRITTDVAQLQDTLSITLAELFRQVVTLVVGVVVIMVISVKLSLFMLATFPLLVLLAFIFGKRIKKLSKSTQEELARTNVIV
jgi:ABC-type multidrug transport system fused ATPase/permease subunit